MARIAGVDLPRQKRVEIALTYIYGIGVSRSNKILSEAGIDPSVRVKDLSEEESNRIAKILDAQGGEDLHPVHIRHRQVGDDDVRPLSLEVRDSRGAAIAGAHVEAGVAEHSLEREAPRGLVVDDQNARHGLHL